MTENDEVEKCYLGVTFADKPTMQNPMPGVTFPPEQVAEADRLEVWHSCYTPDATPDFSLFRLMKGEGKLIAQIRQPGF